MWPYSTPGTEGSQADLVAVAQSSTLSGKTELLVLGKGSGYTQFLLNTETALPETGSEYDFAVWDYNNDAKMDLIVIKKSGTVSGKTEISVLDGAKNYKEFRVLKIGELINNGDQPTVQLFTILTTALPVIGPEHDFAVWDYNKDGKMDLIVIKKNGTVSGKTEISVLDGAKYYDEFILLPGKPIINGDQINIPMLTTLATVLPETGSDHNFVLWDYNRDGKVDLFSIKKNNTASGKIEVYQLNGGIGNGFDNFQEYTRYTTVLPAIN